MFGITACEMDMMSTYLLFIIGDGHEASDGDIFVHSSNHGCILRSGGMAGVPLGVLVVPALCSIISLHAEPAYQGRSIHASHLAVATHCLYTNGSIHVLISTI